MKPDQWIPIVVMHHVAEVYRQHGMYTYGISHKEFRWGSAYTTITK